MPPFFTHQPLKVMLSSRCMDLFTRYDVPTPIAELRRLIKEDLESIKLLDNPVFEVWIHEDEAVAPGDLNSWDTCLERAKQAEILIVLFNGNAGWSGVDKSTQKEIGICHAEMMAAYNDAPSKVRAIRLLPLIKAKPNTANARFIQYFKTLKNLGPEVRDFDEAVYQVRQVAHAALLDLARNGLGVSRKGSYYAGEALAWSRLPYLERRQKMVESMTEYLTDQHQEKLKAGDNADVRSRVIFNKKLLIVCDAIPASMSTAAARELVGQPFLSDYLHFAGLEKKVAGPVHVIACQKSVTESQALKQLGFPDAQVVKAPFGIYIADDIQKIQMVFLSDCRDESTTRHNLQRFLLWLNEQGEGELMQTRATSRRKICDAIARENKDS